MKCWRGYLSGSSCRLAYGPADTTAAHFSCSSKIQIGFTFPVPAHLGSPRQRAVKRVCVCLYYYNIHWRMLNSSSGRTDSGSRGVFPCAVCSVDTARHSTAASRRSTSPSTWHLHQQPTPTPHHHPVSVNAASADYLACPCNVLKRGKYIQNIYNTHTHPFKAFCPRLPGWAGTRKVKPIWILLKQSRDSEWHWHQLGHTQVCTSLQTDNHASTPPLSFLQAGCPSRRPTNSVKALKATYTKRLQRDFLKKCTSSPIVKNR